MNAQLNVCESHACYLSHSIIIKYQSSSITAYPRIQLSSQTNGMMCKSKSPPAPNNNRLSRQQKTSPPPLKLKTMRFSPPEMKQLGLIVRLHNHSTNKVIMQPIPITNSTHHSRPLLPSALSAKPSSRCPFEQPLGDR